MSFVHTSVNEASSSYLQYEKRYNYTTPKSFLEQIALYLNLLANKNQELQAKMQRLENGLEKLRSTADQVDDLKAKLAAQEVELKQKNEDADKLIQIVGVETEKVSILNNWDWDWDSDLDKDPKQLFPLKHSSSFDVINMNCRCQVIHIRLGLQTDRQTDWHV